METGIGVTLREARNRRRLDLAEAEAATKIRVRYLQAIENEDWDVLPGDAYARGFIRTYAIYLGLDGQRLVEEYRRGVTAAGGEKVPRRVEPVASAAPGRRGRRMPGRVLTVLVPLLLIGLLVAIGLTGDEDEDPARQAQQALEPPAGERGRTAVAARPGVSLRLLATGEVWVCLLGSDEEPLVDGEILTAGGEAGPFRATGFDAAFGNGEVELTIDGERARTPASPSPVGYRVGPDGDLTPLEEGERPDCE